MAALAKRRSNRDLSYLRRIFNRAREAGIDAPFLETKLFPQAPGRVRWLTDEEEEYLLVQCARHIRPAVIFLTDSGCRIDEARVLAWKQLRFTLERVYLIVNAEDTKKQAAVGKPLPMRTSDMLRQMKENALGEYVFAYVDRKNKTRKLGDIKTGFNAACRHAGIVDCHIHDLRHHYASKAYSTRDRDHSRAKIARSQRPANDATLCTPCAANPQ